MEPLSTDFTEGRFRYVQRVKTGDLQSRTSCLKNAPLRHLGASVSSHGTARSHTESSRLYGAGLWHEAHAVDRHAALWAHADDQHAEFLDADSSAVLYLSLSLEPGDPRRP